MLITLFVALLTADINRIEAGKRDLCPCCRVESSENNPWIQTDISFSKKVRTKFY